LITARTAIKTVGIIAIAAMAGATTALKRERGDFILRVTLEIDRLRLALREREMPT